MRNVDATVFHLIPEVTILVSVENSQQSGISGHSSEIVNFKYTILEDLLYSIGLVTDLD